MKFVTPEFARSVGKDAASALARMVKHGGRFTYRYVPSEPRKDDALYSPIRHIAAVWFMLEADRALGPIDEVRTAALRAGDQIVAEFLTPFAGQDMLCVLDEGLIKLGGAGLAVTTLCAMHDVTGEERYVRLAERLSRFILSQRQENGDFIHIRNYPLSTVHPTRSNFCTGQALLGLLTLFNRNGDAALLDAAGHSIAYLAKRNYGVAINSHWMLYALEAHFAAQPSAETLNYASRIAAGIVSNADYRKGGHLSAIACRTEGLLAYCRMLRQQSRGDVTPSLDECLRQVRLNLTQLLRFSSDGGAFVENLQKPEVRIDYIQHAGMSFLGYGVLAQENAPERGSGAPSCNDQEKPTL